MTGDSPVSRPQPGEAWSHPHVVLVVWLLRTVTDQCAISQVASANSARQTQTLLSSVVSGDAGEVCLWAAPLSPCRTRPGRAFHQKCKVLGNSSRVRGLSFLSPSRCATNTTSPMVSTMHSALAAALGVVLQFIHHWYSQFGRSCERHCCPPPRRRHRRLHHQQRLPPTHGPCWACGGTRA